MCLTQGIRQRLVGAYEENGLKTYLNCLWGPRFSYSLPALMIGRQPSRTHQLQNSV